MNVGKGQEDGSVDNIITLQEPKFNPKNSHLKNEVRKEQNTLDLLYHVFPGLLSALSPKEHLAQLLEAWKSVFKAFF